MSRTIVVIPCYNEANRLDVEAFATFSLNHPDIHLLFVNDGSRDNTIEILKSLERRDPEHFAIHSLAKNSGKAEAVRHGLVLALRASPEGLLPDYIAFWDADLATPLEDIPRFASVMAADPEIGMVMGSRVHLLGRSIDRSPLRHYLGRIAATFASITLGLRVYDTQCGAKMFRANDEMRDVFNTPFRTHWIFDIEILARLIARRTRLGLPPAETIVYEYPLQQWRDVKGSKIRSSDFLKSFLELFTIRKYYLGKRLRNSKGNITTVD